MRARAAGALALALAAGAGCDWRTFDDLQKQTPVLNTGAPSSFGASDDFGQVVVPVAAPMDKAARYLVSASSAPALALVDIDPAGGARGQALNPPVIADGSSIATLAASPDGKQVLMGAPGSGRVYLLSLDATATTTLFATTPATSIEQSFGMGVAIAPLAGDAAPDFVVASASGLHVYLDGKSSSPPLDYASSLPCALAVSTVDQNAARPVAVAGNVVAVGGGGVVSLFQVSATAITCLGTLSASSPIGQSLAAADFDANGTPDLLVGAPPGKAYLFHGPLVGGTPPDVTITYTNADGTGSFGAVVAAGDVDGKPGVEALVADPDAVVDGNQGAGQVVVYTGPALATKLAVLAASAPAANAAYGTSVNVLPFCAQPPCTATSLRGLALVGSTTRTFTYFKLEADGTDPRKR